MPEETKEAIEWALEQCVIDEEFGQYCVKNNGYIEKHLLVDFVRQYFNENNIQYETFSYLDLEPFLN